MIKKRWFLLTMLMCRAVLAEPIEVNDGDTVPVTLSSKEVTRISIEGSGKIATVRGVEGVVQITVDKEAGDIYLRPLKPEQAFSFFVRDSFGNTYTLAAKTADLPSQSIELKPLSTQRVVDELQIQRYKDMPLKSRVAELTKAMAGQSDITGFDREILKLPVIIKRWKEVEFSLTEIWTGYEIKGEVFQVKNVTSEKLVFHEREFLDVGQGVIAAAMENMQLEPSATTRVFVVKTHGR